MQSRNPEFLGPQGVFVSRIGPFVLVGPNSVGTEDCRVDMPSRKRTV